MFGAKARQADIRLSISCNRCMCACLTVSVGSASVHAVSVSAVSVHAVSVSAVSLHAASVRAGSFRAVSALDATDATKHIVLQYDGCNTQAARQ